MYIEFRSSMFLLLPFDPKIFASVYPMFNSRVYGFTSAKKADFAELELLPSSTSDSFANNNVAPPKPYISGSRRPLEKVLRPVDAK